MGTPLQLVRIFISDWLTLPGDTGFPVSPTETVLRWGHESVSRRLSITSRQVDTTRDVSAGRRARVLRVELAPQARTFILGPSENNLQEFLGLEIRFVNDPSAGSPTETLLRLLLPLNDQV